MDGVTDPTQRRSGESSVEQRTVKEEVGHRLLLPFPPLHLERVIAMRVLSLSERFFDQGTIALALP